MENKKNFIDLLLGVALRAVPVSAMRLGTTEYKSAAIGLLIVLAIVYFSVVVYPTLVLGSENKVLCALFDYHLITTVLSTLAVIFSIIVMLVPMVIPALTIAVVLFFILGVLVIFDDIITSALSR